MATNNLEVKFKVETSDLRKGSSDAKRTVKDSADQMARDVNGAAQNMASSMGKVNAATKSISDAASTASNGVRSLEQNVARSASSMERNLSKVSRQMSAMQMFHIGVRGVQMLGGAAANIATLAGASSETVSGINSATGFVTSGLQGAAAGAAFGTMIAPGVGTGIGAAVGALVGAGNALLEAAVKQKEAAEKQLEVARESIIKSKQTIESIDADLKTRNLDKKIAWMAGLPLGVFDEGIAQHMLDTAAARLSEAEERQKTVQDMIYGRNGQTTTVSDWNEILKGMKFKIGGTEYDASNFNLPSDLGVINWMSSDKIDSVAKFFAESFKDDTVKVFDRIAMAYAAAGLPPPVRPEQLRPEDFDETLITNITEKIVNALKEQSLAAFTAVSNAQQFLTQLAPLQARLDKERAASEARMNAPLNFNEDDWPEYYGGDPTKEPYYWTEPVDKEALAAGAQRLKDLTAMLNGIVGGAGFSSPTDALTRIGGGRGYASYNDSAARVQAKIEANLRTLIKNQTDQNNEILRAIENINVSDPDIAWQQTE